MFTNTLFIKQVRYIDKVFRLFPLYNRRKEQHIVSKTQKSRTNQMLMRDVFAFRRENLDYLRKPSFLTIAR